MPPDHRAPSALIAEKKTAVEDSRGTGITVDRRSVARRRGDTFRGATVLLAILASSVPNKSLRFSRALRGLAQRFIAGAQSVDCSFENN